VADLGAPGVELQIKRLDRQRAQIELNVLDGEIRAAECKEELARIAENAKASRAAIEDIDQEIRSLKEAPPDG
jgi:chromosome segregation ATPase